MRDPLWARYYAAVDRLIEVGAPVAAAKDGDVIVVPDEEFRAMQNSIAEVFAEIDAALAAIKARDQGRENGRP